MKSILLLHGALGSKNDLALLSNSLSSEFRIYTLNFSGHGGEPDSSDFSIEFFASQVLDWMNANDKNTISIVGYSLGGYVALYLAANYPNRVEKVVTLGTKLYWDVSVAERESARLDAVEISAKVPEYADALESKHFPTDWRKVISKTADMFMHMGRFNPIRFEDFSNIQMPVLLIVGDRDKIVSFVETTTVFNQLSHGQVAVLPNTPHGISKVNVSLLATLITTFVGV